MQVSNIQLDVKSSWVTTERKTAPRSSVNRLWVLVFTTALLALNTSCSQSPVEEKSSPAEASRINVAASFYPLYEFARRVGGERVAVTLLVPPGREPHDFEPAPRDIQSIAKAKLFVYNGAGFEPWVDKILTSVASPQLVVMDASQRVEVMAAAKEDEHRGKKSEGGSSQESRSLKRGEALDPHFWLDPVAVKQVVESLRDALVQVDPQGGDIYLANAKGYIEALAALDAEYLERLRSCPKRELIASHAALGYLAKRYNLTVYSIAGVSPEAEPSPSKMKDLAELAREKGIKHVLVEPLVSPKLAQTLAKEVGAATIVFNPIEGLSKKEMDSGKDYLSLMRDNLTILKTALGCS